MIRHPRIASPTRPRHRSRPALERLEGRLQPNSLGGLWDDLALGLTMVARPRAPEVDPVREHHAHGVQARHATTPPSRPARPITARTHRLTTPPESSCRYRSPSSRPRRARRWSCRRAPPPLPRWPGSRVPRSPPHRPPGPARRRPSPPCRLRGPNHRSSHRTARLSPGPAGFDDAVHPYADPGTPHGGHLAGVDTVR